MARSRRAEWCGASGQRTIPLAATDQRAPLADHFRPIADATPSSGFSSATLCGTQLIRQKPGPPRQGDDKEVSQ
jgi:hypothetical protein